MKTNSPTHEAVTQRAQEIWQSRGRPTGQDNVIWLEAERQLSTPTEADNTPSPTGGRGNGNTQASRTPADPKPAELKRKPSSKPSPGKTNASSETERLRGDMASESEEEFHITPAVSDDEAIKAALQKREARSPQNPATIAPHQKPPETGKPVWPKPHSS